MKNPYYPIDTVVEDIITETPTIKTFVLKPVRPIEFRAGQFMQLTVPGLGEAPITPSSDPTNTERMEITILKTGKVTDALHELSPGAAVGLRGPFGKGYPLDKLVGKDVLVAGGGVGLAPMRSLLYALFNDPSDGLHDLLPAAIVERQIECEAGVVLREADRVLDLAWNTLAQQTHT